jgi:hypothetical protein
MWSTFTILIRSLKLYLSNQLAHCPTKQKKNQLQIIEDKRKFSYDELKCSINKNLTILINRIIRNFAERNLAVNDSRSHP